MKRILYLGPQRSEFVSFLGSLGDDIERTEDPIAPDDRLVTDADMIVSYGYRHIVKPDVLDRFCDRAVNLHISLLPWNRGADPNLWSFLEDTPKGVTIHVMDEGVDTGAIYAQRVVDMTPEETLRSSYDRLSKEMFELFCESWPEIRAGRLSPRSQSGVGSTHTLADRAPYEHLLSEGWDTPVIGLIGRAKEGGERG